MNHSNFSIYSNFSDSSVEMLTVTNIIHFIVHFSYDHVSRSCNFLQLGHTSTMRAEGPLQPRSAIPTGEDWTSCRWRVTSQRDFLSQPWLPRTDGPQLKTLLHTFPAALAEPSGPALSPHPRRANPLWWYLVGALKALSVVSTQSGEGKSVQKILSLRGGKVKERGDT